MGSFLTGIWNEEDIGQAPGSVNTESFGPHIYEEAQGDNWIKLTHSVPTLGCLNWPRLGMSPRKPTAFWSPRGPKLQSSTAIPGL